MDQELDAILKAHVAQTPNTKHKLLGAAFTVVNKDGVLYQGSSGRIHLPKDSPPWNPQTLSWLASLTKLATAISLLQVVERQLLTLDADVRPHSPFLASAQILRGWEGKTPLLEDNTAPITLRMLLTHTVGLAYDLADEGLMKWRRWARKDKVNMTWTEEGFATPLLFTPGTDWMYGTAMDWAGMVLEKVTGQRLSEYMAEHIFEPLGMHDTGFWPEKIQGSEERMASLPCRDEEGRLEDAPSPLAKEHPIEAGGAGLFSTVDDYAKLLRAVLQGKLLNEKSMELLFQPQLEGPTEKGLMEKVDKWRDGFAPEFPAGTSLNFTFGGMTNLEDIPGKRSKGSIMWSGYANPHWVCFFECLRPL